MSARKLILPMYNPTEVCNENNSAATRVSFKSGGHYFVQPRTIPEESNSRDGKPSMVPFQFNLYPVILCADGAPWAEANMWILSMLEGKVQPNMSSYASIAEDLSSYLRFIEEHDINWLKFPSQKLSRPTYRFNGHLRHLIQNQEIAASTAKRRMAVVIRFYRWLKEEAFVPENPTWKEGDRYIEFKGHYGSSQFKKVTTTDVSIRVAKQDDPYDRCIQDGGKLRPLTQEEQSWLMDALLFLSNTEMTLIHMFALVTGGRIQTILTFRVRDVMKERPVRESVVRIAVGQGTGIDTKFNKKMVLHIPAWFYDLLRTYAMSERARIRRLKAVGGDTEDQYLFLSVRSAPLYASKASQSPVDGKTNLLRHGKIGQGVRQYMTDYIIPYIRQKFDASFHYQFHDTRATYGMNLVDDRLRLVEQNKTTLKEVMLFVQTRMGHTSIIVTERYLNYRSRLKLVPVVQDGWEAKLEQMTHLAMGCTHD